MVGPAAIAALNCLYVHQSQGKQERFGGSCGNGRGLRWACGISRRYRPARAAFWIGPATALLLFFFLYFGLFGMKDWLRTHLAA
jgi:hypothetical protein